MKSNKEEVVSQIALKKKKLLERKIRLKGSEKNLKKLQRFEHNGKDADQECKINYVLLNPISSDYPMTQTCLAYIYNNGRYKCIFRT